MRVLTIGHGARSTAELLGCLREAGVRTLVDVRRFPGSRRHPQFNRDTLSAAVAGFMCAETLWWQCHRRLIAELLDARGHEVVHLLRPGHSDPHRPWSPISETRDSVLYLCGRRVG
jgi:uncharacterized protein (DUF488 family)